MRDSLTANTALPLIALMLGHSLAACNTMATPAVTGSIPGRKPPMLVSDWDCSGSVDTENAFA